MDRPAGDASTDGKPIRLVYLLRRKPGVSREEFQAYWRDKHGPFVAGLAPRFGIRRYVQSHAFDNPLDAMMVQSRGTSDKGFDGVTEIWWDSVEAFMAEAGTADGAEAARAFVDDEANFVDFGRSIAFFTREHHVYGPGAED